MKFYSFVILLFRKRAFKPHVFGLLIYLVLATQVVTGQKRGKSNELYARNNLVAWVIVPSDAKNRTPEERAEMLDAFGITRLAYDWRARQIPSFEDELDALKKHHIGLQAFWLPTGPDPAHDEIIQKILALLKRHHEKTALWVVVSGIPGVDTMSQEQKIAAFSKPVRYLAEKAKAINCAVGLYNFGGWFGEPENQLAIIHHVKMSNIGIVYNFHHAGTRIGQFSGFFPKILPYLMCINICGLIDSLPRKITPVGKGNLEFNLMRQIDASDYKGPIGIMNENFSPDSRLALEMNIAGIKAFLQETKNERALKTYQP